MMVQSLQTVLSMPDTASLPIATAVILAGGNSSRMGTDKALLPWQGVPLLRRVYEVAQRSCHQVKIITPWPDRYRPVVPITAQFIPDQYPGQGPLWALYQALSSLRTEWLLLLACDLPNLEAAVLERWVCALSHLPADCLAYVPRHPSLQVWEALCACYRRSALPSLEAFLGEGGTSFQAWLRTIQVSEILLPPSQSDLLRNLNQPSDLEDLDSNLIR
ncbi:molybdenum cofactor guanylyltransferase [Lyngbya confervoides]|uniref:Probable molybdenum cofactor guanylyltransferase n=1 Tax=Lyngbya confervoides BDU141951 TaxID=1574623 RepID=A0ABD4T201_9CYAN|nr:molybdenum cofactor guanylyltransferase [Lyngbya confervoides]MCM1982287.1 molybdenum cofactor guanylyltransferase [Lyngbya confervoides BDU141951]